MRKVLLLGLVLAVWAMGTSVASAGIVSLLSGMNTANDNLADDSLGFITDTKTDNNPADDKPFTGDVAWGIAEVDKVNGTSVLGTAYIIYSAQLDAVGSTDARITSHVESTVEGYTLDDLLGLSSTLAGTGSIAAVIEWNGTGVNPFLNETDYPFGPGNFIDDPADLKSDIDTLMDNASVLFAVGLKDTSDYFQTSISAVDPRTGHVQLALSAGFSITYVASGLNLADFKPLFGDPDHEGSIVFGATQVLKSGEFASDGASISTYDQGNYNVNYVPEPASVVALIGLGLMGLAAGVFRRRMRNA